MVFTKFFKQIIHKFEKLILKYKSMFLNTELLNEGKVVTNNSKIIKLRHSEGKSPKIHYLEAKLPECKSIKTQACVNSNWQKLRV